MCSLGWCFDRRSKKRKEELLDVTFPFSLSIELKDITVRIVHAGGREELYHNAVPASQLMRKYPGMCIASPEIFTRPHQSLISAEDHLVPGKKYYLIPSTTVLKLKRKYSRKKKVIVAQIGDPVLDSKEVTEIVKHSEKKKVKFAQTDSVLDSIGVTDASEDLSEDSICSAKDFYTSKNDWSNSRLKKPPKEKKRFVPPIDKPRAWKEFEWEPSLNSIEEISP